MRFFQHPRWFKWQAERGAHKSVLLAASGFTLGQWAAGFARLCIRLPIWIKRGRVCLLKCLLCGAMIEKRLSLKQLLLPGRIPQPKICIKCQSRLVLRKSTHPCPGCGRKLLVSETICWECQQWQHQYGWLLANQSLYAYNDMMREYMKRYKFYRLYNNAVIYLIRLITWHNK